MPTSKPSRTKRRVAAKRARAHQTQAAQRTAVKKKLTMAQYRRRRLVGWSLAALAVIVLAQHLVSHTGLYTLISPGWDDLVAGYPMALLLGIGSVWALSDT